jgi:predicted nucleic acid-binding protein
VTRRAECRAEIELGLALLPQGKQQQAVGAAARAMFEEDFNGRFLSFDMKAASPCARIVATRLRARRPISVEHGQIAAIAPAHGLQLATRNTAHFAGIDRLRVVNPWADDAG